MTQPSLDRRGLICRIPFYVGPERQLRRRIALRAALTRHLEPPHPYPGLCLSSSWTTSGQEVCRFDFTTRE